MSTVACFYHSQQSELSREHETFCWMKMKRTMKRIWQSKWKWWRPKARWSWMEWNTRWNLLAATLRVRPGSVPHLQPIMPLLPATVAALGTSFLLTDLFIAYLLYHCPCNCIIFLGCYSQVCKINEWRCLWIILFAVVFGSCFWKSPYSKFQNLVHLDKGPMA